MQRIKENFLTGPIDPNTGKRKLKSNGENQEPYGDVMDAEIVRLQDDITAQTKIRNDEDDKWVSWKRAKPSCCASKLLPNGTDLF